MYSEFPVLLAAFTRHGEERIQVEFFREAEWLSKDGLRGKTTLHAVSVSYDHSQLYIVLDHQSPDGEAQIREFKVLRLQDFDGAGLRSGREAA